jgi:hypothetical protein
MEEIEYLLRQSFRKADAKTRTKFAELIISELISQGDWGSIFLYQGLLSEAVEQ